MDFLLNVTDTVPPNDREEAIEFFRGFFGNPNPLVVELGSGNGHFLVEYAARTPHRNFIGTEILSGRSKKFHMKVEKRKLRNLLVFRGEIRRTVWEFFYENMIEEFIILFPDPWPKKRHHKHRLMNRAFIGMLHLRLVNGGTVSVATDSADYRDWMLGEFEQSEGFRNFFPQGYSPYPDDYPQSLFLKRFREEQRQISFMRFQKV